MKEQLDCSVQTERLLNASPQEVYSAFEDPALLAQWWGPEGFTNTFSQFEFVPEGRWVFTMHAPNGANYLNDSIFRELVPNERLVIEHIVMPWFRLTVTLSPSENKTLLHWHQEFENPTVAAAMRELSTTANEQVLDRLGSILTKTQTY
ncbi:MAG: SRPBCC domain-containing protein [Zavarzinella sp.]